MKVILAGGGTGGHFFPLVAVVQRLIKANVEVLVIGRRRNWEEKYCLDYKIPFKGISTGKRSGKLSLQTVSAMIELAKGFFESLRILRDFSPDVVLGTGGYVSLPVMLAGFCYRCPLLIHEQNVLPGLATRFLSFLAKEIALSFEGTSEYLPGQFKSKISITGCPLRESAEAKNGKAVSLSTLGLEENKTTLLIMGGSQGAHRLNELIIKVQEIWQNKNLPLQTIHLSGERDFSPVENAYKKLAIKSYIASFSDNIGDIYSLTNLAIVRGGAVTLAELMYWGIPAVIIPYPYATAKHQDLNAEFMERQGAAKVFKEEELKAEVLAEYVSSLVENRGKLAEMAKASRALAQKDAADILVKRIINLAEGSKILKR